MKAFTPFRVTLGGAAVMLATLAPSLSAQNLVLAHRYPLDTDANDTIVTDGSTDGVLLSRDANPGGVFENGGLTLSGNGYVQIREFIFGDFWYPFGDVDNLTPVTVEVFGSWAGGDANQRLFDFGDNDLLDPQDPPFGGGHQGRTYAAVTPADGTGQLNFSMSADLTGGNDLSDVGTISAAGLGANQDFHVAVVIDPAAGVTRLYRNGVLAGTGTLPDTLRQALVDGVGVVDWNNWLGRSQTDGDPLFHGRITEFRIWTGAMSDAQVRQNYNCGPDHPDGCSIGPAPSLAVGRSGGNLTIAWPADALGFNLYSLDLLGSGSIWAPVENQPLTANGVRTMTLPIGGANAFFQLQTD